MKKTLTTLFMTLAVAFTVLLVSGTTSKALETWNANITQTGASDSYVDLEWAAYLGANHYEIYFSDDNSNWALMDDTSDPSRRIYNLTSSSMYYVKIVAYSNYYFDKTPIAESGSVDVITSPKKVEGLKQTDATTSTITMSWNNMAGADGYIICRYNSWDDYTNLGTSTTNSFTIKGLPASSRAGYIVLAVKFNSAGAAALSTSSYSDQVYMRTAPAKVAYVSLTNFWSTLNSATFGWNSVNNVDGYQFQLQDYKGKSLMTKDVTYTSVSVDPFKRGVFTQARCRAYITVDNKRIYGAWSPYNYNATDSKASATRSRNRKKITLKWSKVKGASGYAIYVSTKSDSGYKKVKTLKANKTKYTITKFNKKSLKKYQKYYVQIKYLRKVGKKTVTSGIVHKFF